MFKETSAKDNTGIQELLEGVAVILYKRERHKFLSRMKQHKQTAIVFEEEKVQNTS